MKKVNISVEKMSRFEEMWVAIKEGVHLLKGNFIVNFFRWVGGEF